MTNEDYEEFICWLHREIGKAEQKTSVPEDDYNPYNCGYREALNDVRHKFERLPSVIQKALDKALNNARYGKRGFYD